MTSKQKARKVSALERLTAQEKSGVKTVKKSHTEKTPLTDLDLKRIRKEKEILSTLVS